jgi:hypothetical protein
MRGEHAIYARLSILWFQADWALPIEASIVEKIKRIDWDANAEIWVN